MDARTLIVVEYWAGGTIKTRRKGHSHIDDGPGILVNERLTVCGKFMKEPMLLDDTISATCPRCKELS